MAKQKRVRFTVEGSGDFPFDMLRYDHCWPEHESPDSYNVSLTYANCTDRNDDTYPGKRRVTLLTESPNAPTEARWKSFSWSVVPGSVERVV